MHEIGIAQEIVAIAAQHARGSSVTRIVVEIGRFAGVLPDALHFCFEACAEGTTVEGAVLQIDERPGLGRCRRCGNQQEFERPFGLCPCGATDFDWLGGDELKIRQVEVR